MPRRHQVQNPSTQPKRPSRTSTDSADQFTSQSTSSSSTQKRTQSTTKSSQSSTETRIQPSTQSTAKSKAGPVNPPPSQSHSTSSAGKALAFEIAIPIASLSGADTSDEDKELYFKLKSQQLAKGLIDRPFMLTDGIRIEKLSVRQGPEGDSSTSMVSISVSRPVSQEDVYRAISGPFHVHLAERINEPLSDDEEEPLPTTRYQDMISVLMKSNFTELGSPKQMQWYHVFNQCEMVASVHSLLCHVDRQVEWESFLRVINHHLAAVLPNHPITDSSGQQATHVITSNRDRKLQITLKFKCPCSAPSQSWIIAVEDSITFLFMLVRHRQLSSDPTEENVRILQQITHMMVTAANSAR